MRPRSTSFAPRAALPFVALALLGAGGTGTLSGALEDTFTAAPIAGATVRDLASGRAVETDAQGRYEISVPLGATYTLRVDAPGYTPMDLVHQRPGRPHTARLLPWTLPDQAPRSDQPLYGVPWHRREARAIPGAELKIPGPGPGRHYYPTPPALPATIRVARRYASSCSGNPIVEIQELDFEDYVAGVVPAEIGVFAAVEPRNEAARETFKAFAILARSYALWWYLRSGGESAEYHIDDTACNQRYEDDRVPYITEQVAATAGLVLVKASDPTVIDKYEYAASCGEHGTRPEYQTEIVPDAVPGVACVNTWCGHESCAGHEDNPDLPGTDRCLVRGTCQWGSVERSKNGATWQEILAHYEPNLSVVQLGADPVGNLVGFVRAYDIHTGEGIAGATVTLDTGATTTTDIRGLYRFTALPYGTYTITASAAGYAPASLTRRIEMPGDTWGSIALVPAGDGGMDGGGPAPDGGVDGDTGTGGGTDGGKASDGGAGGPSVTGGCGCTAAAEDGHAGALFLLIVLGLRRRRRWDRAGAPRRAHREASPVPRRHR